MFLPQSTGTQFFAPYPMEQLEMSLQLTFQQPVFPLLMQASMLPQPMAIPITVH